MLILAEHGLPRYDNAHNPETSHEIRQPYADKLLAAEGIVVITPEW